MADFNARLRICTEYVLKKKSCNACLGYFLFEPFKHANQMETTEIIYLLLPPTEGRRESPL